MNIVFFTDTFFPTTNGVSTTVLYYANGLIRAGHKVLIVAPKHKDFHASRVGLDSRVQIFLLPSIDAKVYPDIRIGLPNTGILAVVRQFKPDVIYTCTPFTVGLHGVIIAKRQHVPLVAIHMTNYTDEEALKALGQFSNSLARTALQGAEPLLKAFLHRHKLVLVPTFYAKQYLMDLGIERSIFVVPSPVDTKACRDGRREGLRLRRTLGITQSILSVGRLSAEKNVDLLIRMFARLHERNDSVRLVIIGDGPERKNLFSLASKLGVNTWITWCGNIPHHKLLMGGYYYLGDIFVTLSTMETQGLSTSEAMACGLPIIGARAVGTKEIVGENGILVSPSQSVKIAEAINTLFNNKSDLKRFKEMSLSAVTQFSVDTCVAKLEAINKHLADVT